MINMVDIIIVNYRMLFIITPEVLNNQAPLARAESGNHESSLCYVEIAPGYWLLPMMLFFFYRNVFPFFY